MVSFSLLYGASIDDRPVSGWVGIQLARRFSPIRPPSQWPSSAFSLMWSSLIGREERENERNGQQR